MLFRWRARGVLAQVEAQLQQWSGLAASIRSDLKTMTDSLDTGIAQLQADVASLSTVDQAVLAKISDLSAKLAAALAAPIDPRQQLSAIAEIHAELQAEVQKLTGAVSPPAETGASDAPPTDPNAGSSSPASADGGTPAADPQGAPAEAAAG